jgi:hypothetical protein
VNPSSDIDPSSTTLLIANLLGNLGAAVRRRQEMFGARPAVSTSPRTHPAWSAEIQWAGATHRRRTIPVSLWVSTVADRGRTLTNTKSSFSGEPKNIAMS